MRLADEFVEVNYPELTRVAGMCMVIHCCDRSTKGRQFELFESSPMIGALNVLYIDQ